ncbi:MAG: hypothetical protein JJT94_00645 [Bernardetiaceae bacterium]|nr:hypothetical protein [Bernardetiaceae bacterium]
MPFVRMATIVSFEMKRSEIAAELCKYRAEAGNSCQGSCYLQAQLEKQSESTDKNLQMLKFQEVMLYYMPFVLTIEGLTNCLVFDSPTHTPYNFAFKSAELVGLLRPPSTTLSFA